MPYEPTDEVVDPVDIPACFTVVPVDSCATCELLEMKNGEYWECPYKVFFGVNILSAAFHKCSYFRRCRGMVCEKSSS
jgi:hypothetical protein